MPLLQASPEVRELDASAFRLELKDLEDDEEGMPFLDTHRHVTEVTLSGVTYARFIEIINSYTVEFEAGTYAVSIVGANTNLLDVKVANSTSLLGNNSAGLITVDGGGGFTDSDRVIIAATLANTVSIEGKVDDLAASTFAADDRTRMILIEKILKNRLIVDFALQRLILFDDDGVSPLVQWPVKTDGGEPVVTQAGVQTKREKPL